MLRVDEARARILATLSALPARPVALPEACGSVLAEGIRATEALPPFDNAAVDGYAVRVACVRGASADTPVPLRITGEAPAGRPVDGLVVRPGCAVRVMTGAPLPAGTEAVVMREDTHEAPEAVRVCAPAAPGEHIRRAGEDVAPGAAVLGAGATLKPSAIALLGALGVTRVVAHRRPSVALLATGDELVWPDEPLRPGQIRASSALALEALVRAAGGEPRQLGIVPDDRAALEAALARASQADLILTTGGVSVGDHDLVRQVLEREGAIAFWRIDMQPGKPLAFGHWAGTPLLGLPGNPVSSLVCFELFARPAIRRLAGHTAVVRPSLQARLAANHEKRAPRRQYLRAAVALTDQGLTATLATRQGSHQLTGLVQGNALVVLPEGPGHWAAGDAVEVLLLEELEAYGHRDPDAQ
ncbi:MAG: gephyrin-like molybdotransferase Glp [Candidatus Sericytochromatia bacterium]|nr:gephyrin-like molybdotransferase Glp [Candidatus Sericytochromatia bacterium]